MNAQTRTGAKTRAKVVPLPKDVRVRPGVTSPAKDRTVKRLLYELLKLAERTGRPDVVKLTMRLRSVLGEMGHDV